MATKALLYSADMSSVEKTKENRCKSLVKQLLAVAIGERMYQYLVVRSAQEIASTPKSFIPDKLPSHKAPGTKTVGPVAEQYANCRACIVAANQIGRQ